MLNLVASVIEKNGGSISFSNFMELALYESSKGYYNNTDAIGACGRDFITSPEISQLFGESLAIWVITNWKLIGEPSEFFLVDLGPGNGTMMDDILRALSRVPRVFERISRVYMVEISSRLIACQQKRLSVYERISWCNKISKLPEGVPALFIGNEFLDAIPIDQFVCTGIDGWKEKMVAWDGEKLVFCHQHSERFYGICEPGAVVEHSPMAQNLVKEIMYRVRKFGGKALFIDYGYEEKPYTSTVQSVKNHRYNEDILSDPGSADITAYVDFKALGLLPAITQREFLSSLGFFELANLLLKRASKKQQFDIVTAVDRLTSVYKMGGLFKVAQF